uniref:Uncharacterized protein n=1 Tax=Fagus sylvatica TaxID=28930 RepID=A0A2N9FP40_FAGSY
MLSLLSVLSLRFLLKHETRLGLRFAVGNAGVVVVNGVVIRKPPPPPVRPATTTAHKRPNPLATPRRRDPPRWPQCEGEIHAGHTAKVRSTLLATPRRISPRWPRQALPCRSQQSGGGGAVPISAWRSGSRPGGGGAVPIGC